MRGGFAGVFWGGRFRFLGKKRFKVVCFVNCVYFYHMSNTIQHNMFQQTFTDGTGARDVYVPNDKRHNAVKLHGNVLSRSAKHSATWQKPWRTSTALASWCNISRNALTETAVVASFFPLRMPPAKIHATFKTAHLHTNINCQKTKRATVAKTTTQRGDRRKKARVHGDAFYTTVD